MNSAPDHTHPYQVEIIESVDIEQLQHTWITLQNSIEVPFFLSWHWISCWLHTYNPKVLLVTASFQDRVVAMGLFTRSTQMRRGFINSRQILLHQTGDPLKDQIWMEYNDFMALDEHRINAVNACLKTLEIDLHWDEIVLSMMPATRALEVASTNSDAILDQYRPCYAVNLDNIRRTQKQYLDLLTANTRYQISRSLRLYQQKHGEVRLQIAESTEQALAFFHSAGPYHIERWEDSGYLNPQFVKFHQNLINDSFQHSAVQILKLVSGEKTIAIIYYHIVDKSVYFYLHGLLYDQNKKLKPGLVAHALATQYFIDQGMSSYDFMGGYSQYKEQLADLSENLVTVVIQRPRSRFKLENMARSLKSRIISANDWLQIR